MRSNLYRVEGLSTLTSDDEMQRDSHRDEGLDILILARTDARQADSLDEALARISAFAEAGRV